MVGLPEPLTGITTVPVGPGPIAAALESGEPVIVDDWATETRFEPHEAVRALGIASLIQAPVRGPSDSRPWGVLTLSSNEPVRFSPTTSTSRRPWPASWPAPSSAAASTTRPGTAPCTTR